MSYGELAQLVASLAPEHPAAAHPPARRRDLSRMMDRHIAAQAAHPASADGMAIPAVFASVRLIETTIDQLSLTAPGDPSWLRDPRLYGCLFDQGDLVQYIVSGMASRGAAYLWAQPTGVSWKLAPVDPDAVAVQVASDGGLLRMSYRLAGEPIDPVPVYREWTDRQGRKANNWDGRGPFLLHIPYLITVAHPEGVGPIQAAREALRGYERVEMQAADLLDSGTWSGGRLETDADLALETAEAYQERWVENRKLGKIPVLGSGLRYANDIISPKDAMWLESRAFSAAQVAQMFGIPPDYLGMALIGGASSLSYNNSADNDRRFRRNCLEGFTTQISDALSTLLRNHRDRVEFDWSAWERASGTTDTGGAADAPSEPAA